MLAQFLQYQDKIKGTEIMVEGILERRKFKRLAAYLPVYCRIRAKGEERDFSSSGETVSKNISCGGMLLKWPVSWRCKGCTYYLEQEDRSICSNNSCTYEKSLLPNMELLELELDIGLPNVGDLVKAWAKVIWVKEAGDGENYDLGIQFTQIGENGKEAIASYIQARLAQVIEEQRRRIGELEAEGKGN